MATTAGAKLGEADIKIAIDRGGTFCDVITQLGDQEPIIFKLLSVDPANYPDAPTEAVRRTLEIFGGAKISRGEKLDASRVGTSDLSGALRIRVWNCQLTIA